MRYTGKILIILSSLLLLGGCIVASLAIGSRVMSLPEVWRALASGESSDFAVNVILARIPRTVFGIIAGGALGISGALMQSITRNPIADPSILGVNTGASLFVVCGIAFWQIHTAEQYIWLALLGAALTAVCVYGIASIGGGSAGATPLKLALAGAAISTALSSMISTIMLPKSNVMDEFRFWQVGSISGADWKDIALVCPFLLVGFIMGMLLTPSLNALALGDETATGLGVNVKLVRTLAALAGVLLCGATTALAGPIGFVGLMIPHFMRFLFSADMRLVLPMSAIGGAGLLVISDVAGRMLGRPGELEVGIITAFIGAPVFILIARKGKVRSL